MYFVLAFTLALRRTSIENSLKQPSKNKASYT